MRTRPAGAQVSMIKKVAALRLRLSSTARRIRGVPSALLMLGAGMLVIAAFQLVPVITGEGTHDDNVSLIIGVFLSEGIAFITLAVVYMLMSNTSMQIGNDIKKVITDGHTDIMKNLNESSAALKEDLADQSKRSQEAFDRIIAQSTALYDDIKQHQKLQDEAWRLQKEDWKRQDEAWRLQKEDWKRQDEAWKRQDEAWKRQDEAWKESREEDRKMWTEQQKFWKRQDEAWKESREEDRKMWTEQQKFWKQQSHVQDMAQEKIHRVLDKILERIDKRPDQGLGSTDSK